MGYILCIGEKPDVGRSIAKVVGANKKENGYMIGNGYIVTWAIGHLVGLAEPENYGFVSAKSMWRENKEQAYNELPLIPDEFKLIVLPNTKKQFDIVKELMHREDVELIIDCGDAETEGHILQWLIREKAKCNKPLARLMTASFTEKAISNAMNDLKDINDYTGIIKGEFCKKKADWILGMSLSRCCSLKYDELITVGRVQSPTLYFVIKRYIDIANFKVTDFFQVDVDFIEGFSASNTTRYKTQAEAETIAAGIEKQSTGTIKEFETKRKEKQRPLLFDLIELQKKANKDFDFTAQKTLDIAQSLYETHKILSYPRTESKHLTSDLEPFLEGFVESISKVDKYSGVASGLLKDGLNVGKRIIDDSKVGDHYGLIITEEFKNFDLSILTKGETIILELVIEQMLLGFSADYTYDETKITVSFDNNYEVKASGQIPIVQGYRGLEKSFKSKSRDTEEESENENEGKEFPPLEQGQTVTVKTVNRKSGKTTPPVLLREDTLLAAMENAGSKLENGAILQGRGIGTQSTRGSVIKSLFDREYIRGEKKGKNTVILPTRKGLNIIKMLPSDLYSPQITADWEEKIALIAKGEPAFTEQQFMSEFTKFINDKVMEIKKEQRDDLDFSKEKEIAGACPWCKEPVHKGQLTNPKTKKKTDSFYCSKKDCKFSFTKDNMSFTSRTGKNMTESQAVNLIKNKTVTVTCKSKKGTDYKGEFTIDKNDKGYVILQFEFINSN